MEDDKNYYDYVVKIEELQKKLDDLKRKRSMTRLKEQLTTLNNIYHQTESNISAIKSNLSQFNDSSQRVYQVLEHETKVPMKEECANSVKSVLTKISRLSSLDDKESIAEENNVNKLDNKDVSDKVSKRLDCFKSNYNFNWMFVSNISKIVADSKKEDVNCTKNSNESKSRKSTSDSLGSLMTFCEDNLVASSPIPLHKYH